jgi:hypothetical protein
VGANWKGIAMNLRPRAWVSFTSVATLLVLFALAPARADDTSIAQIKDVTGNVTILRAGAKLAAKPGDPMFQQDTIQTGADGSIGLTFTDNTVMSAGPNSEIALSEYNFNSSDFNGSMLTEVKQGTLSVVSGDIARSSPSAMKVKTPTTILGVRGTRFLVEVAH